MFLVQAKALIENTLNDKPYPFTIYLFICTPEISELTIRLSVFKVNVQREPCRQVEMTL